MNHKQTVTDHGLRLYDPEGLAALRPPRSTGRSASPIPAWSDQRGWDENGLLDAQKVDVLREFLAELLNNLYTEPIRAVYSFEVRFPVGGAALIVPTYREDGVLVATIFESTLGLPRAMQAEHARLLGGRLASGVENKVIARNLVDLARKNLTSVDGSDEELYRIYGTMSVRDQRGSVQIIDGKVVSSRKLLESPQSVGVALAIFEANFSQLSQ